MSELKELKPKRTDKSLQERLNEVCQKHGVSTLQDLDWAFCRAEEKSTALCVDSIGEIARQKRKRCIAYADSWRSFATFCGMQSTCHNHRGFGKTAENWSRREIHAWKCVKRWLAISEKFKEAK